MLQERLARAPRTARLTVRLAQSADEVRQAQKLRYRIFGEEMGARLASAEMGIDCDDYDELCDHLIVLNQASGEVIGTYRMLSPDNARRAPQLYSEHEFDLSRLTHVRDRLVEVGRSCVHPDYRTGGTIALLWSGLAQYVREHNAEYLAGCASVSLNDGGHQAASLYRKLEATHLAPTDWRVFPHLPLPLAELSDTVDVAIPALIKGYLRAGAFVCGEPAWDPDFNCADFFMLLPMGRVTDRYNKHFVAEH